MHAFTDVRNADRTTKLSELFSLLVSKWNIICYCCSKLFSCWYILKTVY